MREMDQANPAEGLLEHIPAIDLALEGNFRHANGLDLPVIVINLPRRVDRWETLCWRLEAVGLTRLIKAPAIDGIDLPEAQIATLMGSERKTVDEAPRSHLSLTRPATGCFLSHLAIWRRLIDEKLPRALILEDDAAPTTNCSSEKFQRAFAAIPDDAGLVFPGLIIMGGLADRSTVSGLARIYYFNGTFAYFVTPAMCQTFLRHLLPLRSHLDHQISRLLIEQRHGVAAYYMHPQLFAPDWSLRSDCYVPLSDEGAADQELGQIIKNNRRLLLKEGRPLLPEPGSCAGSHAA